MFQLRRFCGMQRMATYGVGMAQFSSSPVIRQQLEAGTRQFELGIKIGSIFVVHVELGDLLVAGIGRSGLNSGPHSPLSRPAKPATPAWRRLWPPANCRNDRCSLSAFSLTSFLVRSACLRATIVSASACEARAFCTGFKNGNLMLSPAARLLLVYFRKYWS